MKNAITGFIVAPIIGMLALSIMPSLRHPLDLIIHPLELASGMMNLSPFAYGATAILGIPTFLLFRRMHWEQAWKSIAAGIFLGPVSVLIAGAIFGIFPAVASLQDIGSCSFFGMITTGTFWTISMRANQRAEHKE